MKVRAIIKYVRISPTKVGIAPGLVRGKNIQEAFAILQYTPKDVTIVINKVLKPAVANTENNHEINVEGSYVAEAFISAGPTLEGFGPMGHGKAFRISRRTSNIMLVARERA